MTTYTGKWLFYPWLKNGSNMELIHPEDRFIEGLGVVECIDEQNGYLFLRNKQNTIRAKADGVSKVLPTPAFKWNNDVQILSGSKEGTLANIDNLYWHHLTAQYRYNVRVKSKRLSKDYVEGELRKV